MAYSQVRMEGNAKKEGEWLGMTWKPEQDLKGRIALVAGGTRGAGRGIAEALGERGATVYVSGRTTREARSELGRPETIEETAERVERAGGKAVAVRTDHMVPAQVEALMERIGREQGRLDILVNDIWGGEKRSHWGKRYWESPLDDALAMQRTVMETHYITAYLAAPLLALSDGALIAEITDGIDYRYRGELAYSLIKAWGIHMAAGLAEEWKAAGAAAVSLTPGFLRSEEMLDHFGVSEENWRDAASQDPHFLESETPLFVGRALACLAADPRRHELSGRALSSWELSDRYGFTDRDGRRPHWGAYFATIENAVH